MPQLYTLESHDKEKLDILKDNISVSFTNYLNDPDNIIVTKEEQNFELHIAAYNNEIYRLAEQKKYEEFSLDIEKISVLEGLIGKLPQYILAGYSEFYTKNNAGSIHDLNLIYGKINMKSIERLRTLADKEVYKDFIAVNELLLDILPNKPSAKTLCDLSFFVPEVFMRKLLRKVPLNRTFLVQETELCKYIENNHEIYKKITSDSCCSVYQYFQYHLNKMKKIFGDNIPEYYKVEEVTDLLNEAVENMYENNKEGFYDLFVPLQDLDRIKPYLFEEDDYDLHVIRRKVEKEMDDIRIKTSLDELSYTNYAEMLDFIDLVDEYNFNTSDNVRFFERLCQDEKRIKFLVDFFQYEKNEPVKEQVIGLVVNLIDQFTSKHKNNRTIVALQNFLEKNQPSPILSM